MNILIALTVSGLIALFGSVFNYRKVTAVLSVLGIIVAGAFACMQWNIGQPILNHMMQLDNYAIAFSSIILVSGALIIVFYNHFNAKTDPHLPEIFALITFALAGAVVMVSYTNLLMLFLGVEILSLAFYILAGIKKRDLASNEAAMKYFLMGAFSTAFLLFGIALLYGATASFDLTEIARYIDMNHAALPGLVQAGVILILVGLLFKVAAVPFHFWTPDVYQGAPTIITAFMATVGKVAGFGAFYRLFHTTFISVEGTWGNVVWIIAAITMTLGNITAIYQGSIKRMLAYSSIAHAGYMLMAVLSTSAYSGNSILYYSIAYSLSSVSAFVLVFMVQEQYGNDNMDTFKGIAKGNPLIGFVLAVSMLSLAGIPPTAGFFGKFYVFSSAINAGYVSLVAIAVVNSFISVYYYFRPMIAGILQESNHPPLKVNSFYLYLLALIALATLVLGIVPGLFSGII